MIKKIIKKLILKHHNINIDYKTSINYSILSCINKTGSGFVPINIVNSNVQFSKIGEGCFIEHIYAYGKIELGRFVSISGPGTILHSEGGKIVVGSFSSIAANVSIQEFNHNMKRPSTYAMQYNFFTNNFEDDVVSKGDVIIEEDVWIGSNAVVLSGVRIGRGAVVAAGSVVTKNVPPYAVVAGNPAKIMKMRFSEKQISELEKSRWWEWEYDKIMANQHFFTKEIEG